MSSYFFLFDNMKKNDSCLQYFIEIFKNQQITLELFFKNIIIIMLTYHIDYLKDFIYCF